MKRILYPENNDVACLEAAINYTIFHLKNGKQVISSYTLKKHEESPHLIDFLRVNRKFLVNPLVIKEVRQVNKIHYVVLLTGQELRVSRRRSLK